MQGCAIRCTLAMMDATLHREIVIRIIRGILLGSTRVKSVGHCPYFFRSRDEVGIALSGR